MIFNQKNSEYCMSIVYSQNMNGYKFQNLWKRPCVVCIGGFGASLVGRINGGKNEEQMEHTKRDCEKRGEGWRLPSTFRLQVALSMNAECSHQRISFFFSFTGNLLIFFTARHVASRRFWMISNSTVKEN